MSCIICGSKCKQGKYKCRKCNKKVKEEVREVLSQDNTGDIEKICKACGEKFYANKDFSDFVVLCNSCALEALNY